MTPTAETGSGTVVDAFATVVARFGNRPAVLDAEQTLTFSELDALTDRIAAGIAARGVTDADRVAIALPHGTLAVTTLIGTLKANAVAVPWSISDPPARRAELEQLLQPSIVIDSHIGVAGNPPTATRQRDQPTLLIATSGSTGTAKVVAHSSTTLLSNVARYLDGVPIESFDRVAWLAPITGGQGIVSLLATLFSGAAVCPYSLANRGGAALSGWLGATEITVIDTLPSVMRQLADTLDAADLERIRLTRIASEPAFYSDLQLWSRKFSTGHLVHVLASAETGVIAQQRYDASDAANVMERGRRLPVGDAAPGIELSVSPQGALSVSGAALSLGYWPIGVPSDRLTLTKSGVRMSSSDLVERGDHGLTVLGRDDLQVKVLGHRVQLDQVEAFLLSLPDVTAAAVIRSEGANGVLTGFLVGPKAIDAAAWRTVLAEKLPSYSIPQQWQVLNALPTGPNGKVDRQQLQPAKPTATAARFDGDILGRLAEMWEQVLGSEAATDLGFLSAGGDSLTAAAFSARVHSAFGVELSMRRFRDDPTLTDLAAWVEAGTERDVRPRIARAIDRTKLSFSQVRIWRVAEQPKQAATTIVIKPNDIEGSLDSGLLRRALLHVTNRHDILRTSYIFEPGTGPVATIHPDPIVDFEECDLRAESDHDEAVRRLIELERDMPIPVSGRPLLRWRLARMEEQRWVLLRINHHIIADAWSWRVISDEIGQCMASSHQDGCPLEPPARIQYADVAAREHREFHPDSIALATEVEWWHHRLEGFKDATGSLPFAADPPGPIATSTSLRWGLPQPCTAALDRLGREIPASYFATRLALVAATLAFFDARDRILIDTQISGRREPETADVVGPFMNRVPLPLTVDRHATLRSWLADALRQLDEIDRHASPPMELVRRGLRDRGVEPINPKLLLLARPETPTVVWGEARMTTSRRRLQSPGSCELVLDRRNETDHCELSIVPGRHDPGAARQFLNQLVGFASRAAASPDVPMSSIWQ
jgi:non-ribosomal peptide synthetase component F